MVLTRMSGLLLPLFSLRRTGDAGIGDLIALREWIDWASETGVKFLQLLPVNALGDGSAPSPYSAISSVALEPMYLSLENVPCLSPSWCTDRPPLPPLSRPSGENLVDYERVRQFKDGLLRRAWEVFRSDMGDDTEYDTLRADFEAWVSTEGQWLDDYACFRVAAAAFGTCSWWTWQEQNPEKIRAYVARDPLAQETKLYHQWLQWLCSREWTQVYSYAASKGVMLMGDIPIGVSVASSDVFFERDQFDMSWSGGAPPEGNFAEDPFTGKWGQNWGIPLYRWDKMKQDGFAWWERRIKKTAEIFEMYRIDHILGFYRIYSFPWMPDRNAEFLPLSGDEAAARCHGRRPGFLPRGDDTPKNRKMNLMQGDELLRALMKHSEGMHVIGEDLGCVPDYVRPNLSQLRIAGFKIPHWEIDSEQRIAMGDTYNSCSFATYATHDFAPICTDWNIWYGHVEAGMKAASDKTLSADEIMHRKHVGKDCLRVLGWLGDYAGMSCHHCTKEWDDDIKHELFSALFACRSAYVALMWTELFDHPVRLNTPGTEGGKNWRERLPFTAAEAENMPQTAWLSELIRKSAR